MRVEETRSEFGLLFLLSEIRNPKSEISKREAF